MGIRSLGESLAQVHLHMGHQIAISSQSQDLIAGAYVLFQLIRRALQIPSNEVIGRVSLQLPLAFRNPDNCAMYVLSKNKSSHALYPYFVDDVRGDRLMSSIDLAPRRRGCFTCGSEAPASAVVGNWSLKCRVAIFILTCVLLC